MLHFCTGIFLLYVLVRIALERKPLWCFFFHRKYRKATGKGRMDIFLGIMATPVAFYKCTKCGHEYEKDAGKPDVW